jgi:hypothetical protein
MEYWSDILTKHLTKAKRLKPTRKRWRGHGRIVYALMIPLFVSVLLSLLKGEYGHFIQVGIGFVMLLGVATATAKGLRQEETYHETVITRAPKVPYKTMAMGLLGVTILYLSWVAGGKPLFSSLFVGILGSVGYLLYYGLDPLRDKLPDMGDISPELVLKTLNEAQNKLAEAQESNARITDRILHRKIDHAIEKAHQILETIQHDPKDLRVARKFLVVFVDGIAEVTQRYTEVDEADIDETMRQRLHSLIDDVQNRFDKELARLKANNLFDLDVSIDTLKSQVNH